MKIGLAVGYFDPQVGGSEEVVRRLAVGLGARGHDVIVVTSPHPYRDQSRMVAPVFEFDVTGNVVQGIRGDANGYTKFLMDSDRDVWLFYAAQIWSTDLALPILPEIPAATIIVPCGYSGLRNPAYADYFLTLPALLARSDALVYMSTSYQDFQHDAAAGLGHLAHVIPNGAGEDEFEFLPSSASDAQAGHTILTVANHYPAKGHDAVIRAFRKSAGKNDRLVIVGERTPGWRASCWPRCRVASFLDRRIILAPGLSRSDVVRTYGDADVFLFGSKVECAPLVLIEAMAAGVPFVTTDVGNARDYADAGLIVEPIGLPAALRSLLGDPELRRRLGAAGRQRWERGHRWSRIVDQYEALMRSLVSPEGRGG